MTFEQRLGMLGGLMVVLSVGLVGALLTLVGSGPLAKYSMVDITLVETLRWQWKLFCEELKGDEWIVSKLYDALIHGFTDSVKADKASPNQGIKLSWKNSLVVLLVAWLTGGPILGLWLLLRLHPAFRWMNPLTVGLVGGLIFGLSVGLNRGGLAVIKHYALRLILWIYGYTPLNYVKFLDHCAKLILLKKVGGGYIFLHRMLLEYFADLTPQSIRTTGSK
jgi:hypothetical protein